RSSSGDSEAKSDIAARSAAVGLVISALCALAKPIGGPAPASVTRLLDRSRERLRYDH
ncbi:MAG: hypothetical protein H6Q91_3375, partial [Deltaproteobacteria bacterium]|nr:hypothetical protein [Deltaproteobacteria bacterium]